MTRSGTASERFVALFLLGVLLFNPPFLSIFDNSATIVGLPLLYFYLFVAWAVLIALMALAIEKSKDEHEVNTEATTGKPSGAARGLGGAN